MIYAIGDCHGKLTLVKKLYTAIQADIEQVKDPEDAIIIFLGDYIDRGEDSKGVLDFCMQLQNSDDVKHIFLYGNHEDLMYNAMNGNHGHYHTWMKNGGYETFASFGMSVPPPTDAKEKMLPYLEWIGKLPYYYEKDKYVFCHSGYFRSDFNISFDHESQKNLMLWGRTVPGQYHGYGKTVVHGHTITQGGHPYKDINPLNAKEVSRINVDIGGFYYERLCAVRLPHGDYVNGQEKFIQVSK